MDFKVKVDLTEIKAELVANFNKLKKELLFPLYNYISDIADELYSINLEENDKVTEQIQALDNISRKLYLIIYDLEEDELDEEIIEVHYYDGERKRIWKRKVIPNEYIKRRKEKF